MSNFKNNFDQSLNRNRNAHKILKQFSVSGLHAEMKLEEASSVAVLLQGAFDTNRPFLEKISKLDRQDPLDVIGRETTTFAATSFSRNDIAPPKATESGDDRDYPLKMVTNGSLRYSQVNPRAHDDISYSDAKWKYERLAAIDTCLEMGANIISLGEFDYPPICIGTEEDSFNAEIQRKIDAANRPIFLIAGSRHDPVNDSGCFNNARIFVNQHMNTVPRGKELISPMLHGKLVSAEKAGEKISTPDGVNIKYYETNIGNIAVLICVDAYNPTVIFSLINHRRTDQREQIDYIIVPSYNTSPKLYYACQVLSLMCKCCVLLVDACGVSSHESHPKPAELAFFVRGRLFSDVLGSQTEDETKIGEIVRDENAPHIRGWKLSNDYLIERNHEDESATPFFDSVDTLATQELFVE